MDYNDWQRRLLTAAATTDNDTPLLDYLPQIIDQAEQRCYRDLDLLATVVRDSSTTTSVNLRDFTLPQAQGRFVVVNGINVVTPAGAVVTNGTRNRVTQLSLDALDNLWPTNTSID